MKAGLGSYPAADQYVYLTREPIVTDATWGDDNPWPDLQQEKVNGRRYSVCWFYNMDKSGLKTDFLGEKLPQPMFDWNDDPESVFSLDPRSNMTCVPGTGRPRPRYRSSSRCCCRRSIRRRRTNSWA